MGDNCRYKTALNLYNATRLKVARENIALKKKELFTELAEATNVLSQVKVNKERNHDTAHIHECMSLTTMADQLIDKLKDLKILAQEVIIHEQNLRSTPGRGQRADSGVYSADLETLDPAILARETRAPRVASESTTTAIDDYSVGTETSKNSEFIAQCSGDSEA